MKKQKWVEPFERLRKPLSGALLKILFFSFFLNGLVLTLPIYMLQVYDRVIPTQHLATLGFLTAIAIVAVAVYVVLEIVRGRLLAKTAAWAEEQVRKPVLQACVVSRSRGRDVGKRPLEELDTMRAVFSGAAFAALFDLPWLPVFIGLIWAISGVLGAAALVSVALMIGVTALTDVSARKSMARSRVLRAGADRFALAVVQSANSVVGMKMGPTVFRVWSGQLEALRSVKSALDDRMGVYGGVTKGVRIVIQIAILGLGAFLAVEGEITIGTIIAVSIMLGRALAPVDVLVGGWKQMGNAKNALVYVNEFLQSNPTDHCHEKISLPKLQGALDVQGLTCAGPNGGPALLSKVRFHLPAGERLGVIGPSGAGKSSLCKAVLGYLPIAEGIVRFDGADIRDWKEEDLANHVGYLPQRAEFLPGTIRDNIARFQDTDDADVVEAAKRARVHEIILGMPQGYATKLGADGAPLSGGQQQRIGLARAFFRRPSLIVLDEPNANLDGEGAAALEDALGEAAQWNATIIMVVHTASMLKGVDKILALRNGVREAFGPAQDILAQMRPMRQAV